MDDQEIIENLKQFVVIDKIITAKTPFQQFFGLMFRKSMPYDYGLWFEFEKPKNIFIHSCFMRFNINILFFNEKYELIKIIKDMKPWKFVKVKNIKGFLEMKSKK